MCLYIVSSIKYTIYTSIVCKRRVVEISSRKLWSYTNVGKKKVSKSCGDASNLPNSFSTHPHLSSPLLTSPLLATFLHSSHLWSLLLNSSRLFSPLPASSRFFSTLLNSFYHFSTFLASFNLSHFSDLFSTRFTSSHLFSTRLTSSQLSALLIYSRFWSTLLNPCHLSTFLTSPPHISRDLHLWNFAGFGGFTAQLGVFLANFYDLLRMQPQHQERWRRHSTAICGDWLAKYHRTLIQPPQYDLQSCKRQENYAPSSAKEPWCSCSNAQSSRMWTEQWKVTLRPQLHCARMSSRIRCYREGARKRRASERSLYTFTRRNKFSRKFEQSTLILNAAVPLVPLRSTNSELQNTKESQDIPQEHVTLCSSANAQSSFAPAK